MRRLLCLLLLLAAFPPGAARAQYGYEDVYERSLRPRTTPGTERLADERSSEAYRLGLGVSLPGAVDPDVYVVGPGDVFELNFSGGVSEAIPVVIGPEGTTYIPGWGGVRLAGLTVTEARAEVGKLFRDGLRGGVRWDLRLRTVRRMRVFVTGDVRQPGHVDIPATSRVADALTAEVLNDRASRRNIRITRRDGTRADADLLLFHRTGRQDLNPFLLDGDVIHVPTAVDFVEIYGAVAQPGRVELGPRDSLSTLFALAGGPLPATLIENAMIVTWKSPTEPDTALFSIEDLYSGYFDLRLREGDRVYAYFLPAYHELYQATILGEVERPGTYPIELGRTRLSDVVRSAGGFRARADLSTIRLYRAQGARPDDDSEFQRLSTLSRSEMTSAEYEILRTRLTARREDHRVDWNRLRASPELDILIANGDIVRVDPVLASVRVEGEVRRPGLVDFDAAYSLREYVELAGGYSKRADRRKILVTRTVSGQTLPIKDVNALAPGDMIWVPTRPDRTFWDHLQTLIAVSAQVATVVIAVRAAR